MPLQASALIAETDLSAFYTEIYNPSILVAVAEGNVDWCLNVNLFLITIAEITCSCSSWVLNTIVDLYIYASSYNAKHVLQNLSELIMLNGQLLSASSSLHHSGIEFIDIRSFLLDFRAPSALGHLLHETSDTCTASVDLLFVLWFDSEALLQSYGNTYYGCKVQSVCLMGYLELTKSNEWRNECTNKQMSEWTIEPTKIKQRKKKTRTKTPPKIPEPPTKRIK